MCIYMKKWRVRRKIWGDFIEKRYKSKDEIKRNKRLFLRREHYDNDNNTNVEYDKKDFMKENAGK